MPLYTVGKPAIWNRDRFQELVERILDTGILTNSGAIVEELEERVSQLLGAQCVAVSSGTTGLELVMRALDLSGKTVAMPSFTYVATPHAAIAAGSEVVFHDVEPRGLSSATDTISGATPAALLAVNLFGGCGDLERLQAYADKKNIPLIFDSAHAFGVKYKGQPVSNFGLASVFSLHATKLVQGFEGGLVVTRSQDLADKLRRMRNFGIDSSSPSPHSAVVGWGVNAKLSEIHAAMALTSLDCVEDAIDIHRRNFLLYKKYVPAGVTLVEYAPQVEPNFRFVMAMVKPDIRDRLVAFLAASGCHSRVYFDPPCHRLPPYNLAEQPALPVTDEIARSILALPTGPAIEEAEIEAICGLLSQGLEATAPA